MRDRGKLLVVWVLMHISNFETQTVGMMIPARETGVLPACKVVAVLVETCKAERQNRNRPMVHGHGKVHLIGLL